MMTDHAWTRVLRPLIAGALLAAPAAAHAQDPPRLAVAVAGGVANPLHADMNFLPPEWQVSLRAQVSPHGAIEGFYDEWRESSTFERLDAQIFGPGNVIGRAGRLSHRNLLVVRTLGMSALATGTFGRMTVSGGGGPGYMVYERVNRTRFQDCEPVLAFCGAEQTSDSSSDSFSLHGLARAEFLLTSRFGLFGQFQTSTPVKDAGSTHLSFTGGVRLTLIRGS